MFSNMFSSQQKIRRPVCAGRFYPEKKEELTEMLQHLIDSERGHIDTSLANSCLCGAVVPHAGYVYSGYQAVHAFELISKNKNRFETFVIINPNHTGAYNSSYSLCTAHKWETPLGDVDVDVELSGLLGIDYCDAAHFNEHSGEVILPYLQYFINYPFKIVMITMNRQTYKDANELARKIKEASVETGRKTLILASTDFSHFESPNRGYEKDQLVVDQIMALDSKKIEEQVVKHNISMCGYGPVMAMIEYTKICCNESKMKMLKRGHSGMVFPSNRVVDYISFICHH
jgi:MEMO1 family protein